MPPALRAFAHRDFRLFFAGQLVSLIGTWMQSVAESWLVYRLTGSAVLLGMVGFAAQFPTCLLAPAGGNLADTRSRHRIILATQLASMLLALALAGLSLSGLVRIWHLFALAALLGVVNAFDLPARQAFLAELVGRADLMNAIALNSAMFNGARVVGPAVAGILVAVVGEGWCFLLNGLSYVAVLACLLAMRPRPAAGRPGGSALGRLVEGFGFVARTAPIRALLLLLGLASLAGMPYAVLMPIFAKQVLHGDARSLGLLMGASGCGALLGALALVVRREVRGLGRWVAWATAGFGASLIAFGLSRSFWLSELLLVPVGFALIVQASASNTLIQAMVPDHLRGRVMAFYAMMFMGMAPIGALLAGVLAGRIGAPATVAAGGVVCIVGAAAFGVRLPELRAEGWKLLIAQEACAGDPPTGASVGAAAVTAAH
ncbi:MAG TPA: MFS transporter [Isosphaeraceae bacterium]|jgi:MFS family permease